MAARLSLTVAATAGGFEHVLEMRETAAGEQASELRYRLDEDTGLVNWARLGRGRYSILIGGRSYDARVTRTGSVRGTQHYEVRVGAEHYQVTIRDPRTRRGGPDGGRAAGPLQITAPMPGKVVKLLVREGEEVTAGQGLLVMEAMKMQNELRAPRTGRVERIHTSEGSGVETGSPLLQLI